MENETGTKRAAHVENTFYYIAIPLLRNALAFLTLPIMTRYLVPADYGKLSLIVMIVTFVYSFFTFNINESSYRYFFKYKDDLNLLKMMLSSNLMFLMTAVFAGGALLSLLFPFLNSFFFRNELKILWILIAFFYIALLQINTMNQYIFQNKYEGKNWFKNELIAIMIQIPLTLILIFTKKFTFEAVIISGFFTEFVRSIIIFVKLRGYYSFAFQSGFFKESFAYAWPMFPNVLINFIYTSFDKTILNTYKGISQVGILDLSSRVTIVLKMLIDGVSSTFSPITMDLLTENSRASLEKLSSLYLKVLCLISFATLGIILFTQELIILLTTKDFYFAMYVVPIYIYYHFFGVLGMISYWLIRYPGKTGWTIPINIVTLASSIIASILLIPAYGVIGVAIASFISICVFQILQYMIGIKLTPVPIKTPKIILVFSTLFFETGLVYILYYLNLNFFINILIKLALLALFLIICFSLKIVAPNEVKSLILYCANEIKRRASSHKATNFLYCIL